LAFYRGSRAQQRKAIEELREGAERAERKVITFNCQRYARQERVWPLMVQSLVLRIQDLVADHIDLESKVDGLLRSLDEFIDGQLSQSRKVRLLESLDYELEGLLKVALTKSPLVVLVKGLGTLEPRAMVELVEFISGSLEIRRLCFVMSLHESAITKGLDEHYRGESPLTAQEFLEESFPALIALGPPEPEAPRESAPRPRERAIDELPPPAQTPAQAPAPAPAPAVPAPHVPPSTPVPPPAGGHPDPGMSGQLVAIYPDPMLQEKLITLQRLTPQIYWNLDRDPGLLVALERLTRGDNSPALQHQLSTNDLLRSAFADPTIRAVLVKPPYFDPTPLELDRMGSVSGLRMVSDGPTFDMSPAEPRGLESENGSSIQARLTGDENTMELDDFSELARPSKPAQTPASAPPSAPSHAPAHTPAPAAPPATRPKPKAAKKKRTGAKKIKTRNGVKIKGGTKTRTKTVKGGTRQVKGPRKTKTPAAKRPAEKAPARPEPEPPVEEAPSAFQVVEEAPGPVQNFVHIVESGDIPAVTELARKELGTLDAEQLEELAKALFKLTHDGSNRVKAAAAFALGHLGGRVSQRTAQKIKDQLLTLTGQSHREVREEAAKALSTFKKGMADPPPPPPPPSADKGERPTFGVVSKPPAKEGGPSFAVVDEPAPTKPSAPSFAVVDDDKKAAPPPPPPDDKPGFAVVEDDKPKSKPKKAKASFAVVKDEPAPAKTPAPSFAVVGDDKKTAPPPPPPDDKPKSKPKKAKGSFAVINDEPAKPAKASFAVVNDDEKPKPKKGSFAVVDDGAADDAGAKKPAKKGGFQVVN